MNVSKRILIVAPYALFRQGIKIALSQNQPSLPNNFGEADRLMARHVRQPWDLIVLSDSLFVQGRIQAIRQLISA